MTEQAWVRVERTFAAPIAEVWAMWTDPARFAGWYGPNGMSVPVAEMDLRPGGVRRICMASPAGPRQMTMWLTGVFKEIVAPKRLVYTEAMCTEDGTLISPAQMGMPAGTPDITEVIVDLTEVPGGTRMVMVHVGVPEGTAGGQGWAQAFDKLAAALA